jgi:hypothetical protein
MSIPEEPRSWSHAREQLLTRMRFALCTTPQGGVNLSLPKHTITTPCLREISFDTTFAGKALDVRWSDGSRTSFPCGALKEANQDTPPPTTVLRLGLMSFRHPELDYIVDLYACRNRELALLGSMSAEEEYSYERAKEILLDPALSNGAVIEVYHTGLEPMVVGFYRGVVAALYERSKKRLPHSLWVCPMFYAGPPERSGLNPNSSGAKPTSYIPGKVWM